MAEQRIKVSRAFFVNGAMQKKDSEIKVDSKLAHELRSNGKAEFITEPTKAAPAANAKKDS